MIDFIINPMAGGKNGKKMKKAVEIIKARLEEKNVEYSFHFTAKIGDAKTLTENLIKRGAKTIVAVGGDGTLHEIINGFSDFDKTALGIIPCGTGNDFAASLLIPKNVLDALELILNGTAKYVDFMQMPSVRGLNIIGMGVDVDVLRRYAALKKKTKFGYTLCLIKSLMHIKMTKFSAEMNGGKKDYVSFIACVANGHRYGGGIPICPVADSTDKKLDFVAIKEMHGLNVVKAFLKLKKGKILAVKGTTHETMTEIKVNAAPPYTLQVDGELYENIPFDVKIISDTLRVYRP